MLLTLLNFNKPRGIKRRSYIRDYFDPFGNSIDEIEEEIKPKKVEIKVKKKAEKPQITPVFIPKEVIKQEERPIKRKSKGEKELLYLLAEIL